MNTYRNWWRRYSRHIGSGRKTAGTDLHPGFNSYHTAFLVSLDVKTAFDVAKPAVESIFLTLTGVHGHAVIWQEK